MMIAIAGGEGEGEGHLAQQIAGCHEPGGTWPDQAGERRLRVKRILVCGIAVVDLTTVLASKCQYLAAAAPPVEAGDQQAETTLTVGDHRRLDRLDAAGPRHAEEERLVLDEVRELRWIELQQMPGAIAECDGHADHPS